MIKQSLDFGNKHTDFRKRLSLIALAPVIAIAVTVGEQKKTFVK